MPTSWLNRFSGAGTTRGAGAFLLRGAAWLSAGCTRRNSAGYPLLGARAVLLHARRHTAARAGASRAGRLCAAAVTRRDDRRADAAAGQERGGDRPGYRDPGAPSARAFGRRPAGVAGVCGMRPIEMLCCR
jgi:hypothetical protein